MKRTETWQELEDRLIAQSGPLPGFKPLDSPAPGYRVTLDYDILTAAKEQAESPTWADLDRMDRGLFR